MVAVLCGLPPETLVCITELLDAKSIGLLWMTGNGRLQNIMGRGGVRSFVYESFGEWPRLITRFALRSFKFWMYMSEPAPNMFNVGLDMTLLPRSLESLVLDSPDALSGVARLSCPLGEFLPQLHTLEFANHLYVPEFNRLDFPAGLPKSLTKLLLPRNFPLDPHSLLRLPCKLNSLRVTIRPIEPGQEHEIRNADAFDRLETLDAGLSPDCAWTRLVPPSVRHLFLDGQTMLHFDVSETFIPTPSDLESLPAHLATLHLSPKTQLAPTLSVALDLLPKSLTSLRCQGCELSKGFPSNLPRSLVHLATPRISISTTEESRLLPPGLTYWQGASCDIPESADKEQGFKLPMTLTKVTVRRLTDYALGVLPPSITSIGAERCMLTVPGATTLSTRFAALTSFHLVSPVVDCALLEHLPALLEALTLVSLKEMKGLDEVDWVKLWRKHGRLETLWLQNLYGVLPTSFWENLQSSSLKVMTVLGSIENLPSSMAFLPKGMSSCEIRAVRGTTHPRLTEPFFYGMPSSLRSLVLQDFPGMTISHEVCLHLSRNLLVLLLNSIEGVHMLDFTCPDDANRMELMWKFLAKVPRFLRIAISGKEPDYFEYWRDLQYDDRCQALPDVAYEGQESGLIRPNGSPVIRKL